MSNTSFFGWIREGVKDSVIRGVGDAIEQLGVPDEDGNAPPQVLAFLRGDGGQQRMEVNDMVTTSAATTAPNRSRRRLGKSLKEIDGAPS